METATSVPPPRHSVRPPGPRTGFRQRERVPRRAFATLRDDLRLHAGYLYVEQHGPSNTPRRRQRPPSRWPCSTRERLRLPHRQARRLHLRTPERHRGRLRLRPGRRRQLSSSDADPDSADLLLRPDRRLAREELDLGSTPARLARQPDGRGPRRGASVRQRRSSRACCSTNPRTSRATRSPRAHSRRGGRRRLLRLPFVSMTRCWACRSATPAGTACRGTAGARRRHGLRMGIEDHLKLTSVFAKLNRSSTARACRAASSRSSWASSNATATSSTSTRDTHALLFRAARRGHRAHSGRQRDRPVAEVRFRRGFERVKPGDVLVLMSDGILERANSAGDFFGRERVEELCAAHRGVGPNDPGPHLRRLARVGDGRPWEDDATLVVVRRQPELSAGSSLDIRRPPP